MAAIKVLGGYKWGTPFGVAPSEYKSRDMMCCLCE